MNGVITLTLGGAGLGAQRRGTQADCSGWRARRNRVSTYCLGARKGGGDLSADSPSLLRLLSCFPLVIVSSTGHPVLQGDCPLLVSQGPAHALRCGASFPCGSGRNSGCVSGRSASGGRAGWSSGAESGPGRGRGRDGRNPRTCKDWSPTQGAQKRDKTLPG